MNILECNLALAKLNPYLDKPKIRELLKIRRGLQKQQDKKISMENGSTITFIDDGSNEVFTGVSNKELDETLNDINIPESLREQN